MRTISAYKARVNFGELINRVYYRGEDVVIERKGRPMVKISRINNSKKVTKSLFRRAAGAWKDLDTKALVKNIYKSRKDSSSKKRFLSSW